MTVRSAPIGPAIESIFTDPNTIVANTAGTWWILGATTGTSGTDGTVAKVPGFYLIRGEWFSNTPGNGGVIVTINGAQVGSKRDARNGGMYSAEGLVSHPGGTMSYSIKFLREANVQFGLSNDSRWARRLTIIGPLNPAPRLGHIEAGIGLQESVFTDDTVITANTATNWWLLGSSTGTGGGPASVAKLPGYYLCRAEWFVNTNQNGGVQMKINGTRVGNWRDARSGRFFECEGWVLHPGGNMTYEIYFASESGTTVFGLAGDARWGRYLSIIGPFPSTSV